MRATDAVPVEGPFFEDLEAGQVDTAPALTLSTGHTAVHQAIVGDRLRLALDSSLSRAVTGRAEGFVHPALVCDVAIGQSTWFSQRVKANLFYRGLVLQRPVFVGDTLQTRTEVVGLKQSKPGKGTGLAALRVTTANQHGEPVLDFWRCPMLPMRDPSIATGHADSFDDIPAELDLDRLAASARRHFDLAAFRSMVSTTPASEIDPGTTYAVVGRDTVTSAPELARLTLNLAMTHHDAASSAHGQRLVYGGHTIGIAAAHAARAMPGLVTILAWHACDHTGPVFEGDVLATEITVEALHLLDSNQPEEGVLMELRAIVSADREAGPVPVLDWRFVGLVA